MGYYAHSDQSDMLILKSKQQKAEEAVFQMIQENPKLYPQLDDQMSLVDIFEEFGFTASTECNGNGDIDELYYEHQKFHTDEVESLFYTIAPFVERGSYICFRGEDDGIWAYYFDGTSMSEYAGHTKYGDMPMCGSKQIQIPFNANTEAKSASDWIRAWFDENGKGCKAVIGLSGGKDSAVVAALCIKALGKERVVGVTMPDLMLSDSEYIYDLVDHIGIQLYTIPITSAVADVRNEIESSNIAISEQATVNLPARMRMLTLYAVSQSVDGRVANTCNLSENYIGYLTRHGDGAGDFAPVANFTCTEVVEIGKALGLPDHLVEKTPSDGLCGKTDEDNLGFSYEVLDRYIRTGEIEDDAVKQKIDDLHLKNAFKQRPEPSYNPITF